MTGALRTHEDQVQPFFGYLSITDGFGVLTELALDVFASTQSGVPNALGVNFEIFSLGCVVRPIYTIVQLITFSGLLSAVTLLALKLQVVSITLGMLPRVKHVVALSAEPHPFEVVFVGGELRLRKLHFAYFYNLNQT